MGSRAFLGEDALRVAIGSALAALAAGCSSQPSRAVGATAGPGLARSVRRVVRALCDDRRGASDASDDAGTRAMTRVTLGCASRRAIKHARSSSRPRWREQRHLFEHDARRGDGTDDGPLHDGDRALRRAKAHGLRAPEIACDDPIGAWFAEAAWLEAASVGAFRRLARELRAHGARNI